MTKFLRKTLRELGSSDKKFKLHEKCFSCSNFLGENDSGFSSSTYSNFVKCQSSFSIIIDKLARKFHNPTSLQGAFLRLAKELN